MVREKFMIINVQSNAPAAQVGIKIDDEITRINHVDVQRKKFRDLINLLRGPVRSDVNVRVYRASQDRHLDFTITRQLLVPNTVTTQIKEGVGYIKISSFNQATAERFATALQELSQIVTQIHQRHIY